jgi:hypothetical protein
LPPVGSLAVVVTIDTIDEMMSSSSFARWASGVASAARRRNWRLLRSFDPRLWF